MGLSASYSYGLQVNGALPKTLNLVKDKNNNDNNKNNEKNNDNIKNKR